MGDITLPEAKKFLGVSHDTHDAKLLTLLAGAVAEGMSFMNREDFSDISASEPEFIPGDVRVAFLMLLQANYQASPEDQAELRKVAEYRMMPFRCGLGV